MDGCPYPDPPSIPAGLLSLSLSLHADPGPVELIPSARSRSLACSPRPLACCSSPRPGQWRWPEPATCGALSGELVQLPYIPALCTSGSCALSLALPSRLLP
eukprot:1126394-Rhodomonas_salina.1